MIIWLDQCSGKLARLISGIAECRGGVPEGRGGRLPNGYGDPLALYAKLLVRQGDGRPGGGVALIRTMQDQRVADAGLDVLEEEPTPEDNPLLNMDNVLVTLHLAGFSVEADEKSRNFALENTLGVAGGEELESVVLPD